MRTGKCETVDGPRTIVWVRIKAVGFSVIGSSGRRVSLAQINFRHLDSSGLN